MFNMVLLGSLCFILTVHAEDQLLSAKEIFTEEAAAPSSVNPDSNKKKNNPSTQSVKKPKTEEEDASSPSILKPKGEKDPYQSN